MVVLNGRPTLAVNWLAPTLVGHGKGSATVMEHENVTWASARSTYRMEKVYCRTAAPVLTVPLMTPVLRLRLNPEGRLPELRV